MKMLFDTNVVLDVMLDRKPFVNTAEQLFSKVEMGGIIGFVSATTITTIYCLATKAIGSDHAKLEINKLLSLFEIAPINRAVLESAIKLNFPDFEDAVLHEAARHIDAQAIVTRNINDFKHSTLNIYTPEELIKLFETVDKNRPKNLLPK